MGHKGGLLLQSFIKPTIQQLFDKYIQAVDAVTISEENKLRREVQTLKIRTVKVDGVLEEIAELKQQLGLI